MLVFLSIMYEAKIALSNEAPFNFEVVLDRQSNQLLGDSIIFLHTAPQMHTKSKSWTVSAYGKSPSNLGRLPWFTLQQVRRERRWC